MRTADWIEIETQRKVLEYISDGARPGYSAGEVYITLCDFSNEAEDYIRQKTDDRWTFPHCEIEIKVNSENMDRIKTLFNELINESEQKYRESDNKEIKE